MNIALIVSAITIHRKELIHMNCNICGHEADFFSSAELMRKYNVKYYHCPECGFVQTESPYWLDEAYSSAIADADIGLLGRNYSLAKRVSAILKTTFPSLSNFMDWVATEFLRGSCVMQASDSSGTTSIV